MQDNQERKFKLPPPPFGRNNIPSLNKMSSKSQGSSTKLIDKSNLGDTNLSQNPIFHPVNISI